MRSCPVRAFVCLLCFSALLWTARAAFAEGEEEGDGPVFLFISLSDAFESPDTTGWTWNGEEWVCECECECEYCDCEYAYSCECECCDCECDCGDPPEGSPVLIVPIGMFTAGGEVGDTRFTSDVDAPDFEFDTTPDEHQYAVIGSFDTSGENTVHLVTPGGGAVPAAVQQAFFHASNHPDFADLFPESTTLEIATFIFDHRDPVGAEPTFNTTIPEIMNYLFTPQDIVPEEGAPLPPPANPGMICESPCEAEGDLFAHEGDSVAEFGYALTFDPADIAGSLVIEVCLRVDVDIKPGSSPNSINLKKQGKLTVAILGSDTFDVTDIDEETVAIVGVVDGEDVSVGPVVKNNGTLQCAIEDVDDDGDDDLVCHFSVPDLVAAGLLDKNSTKLTIHGDTTDGCIEGIDSVSIVTK